MKAIARAARPVLFAALASCVAPAVHAHAVEGAAADAAAEPWVVALLAVSLVLYVHGLGRLWRSSGPGRGLGLWRVLAFAGGWATLVLALLSPLDAWGARLFSAHMVQHELLMLVAAPLFVLGRPLAAWGWALPRPWTRGLGRFFQRRAWQGPWRWATGALGAWVLHALALWLWHLPALFDAALHDETVHALQHASFLGSALLFWWSVLGMDARRRQAIGPALLSLFTTMLHTGALGALLTLAPQPWYMRGGAGLPMGLDALADQQLGGLVMWVPGSLAYLACGLWLAARLLNPGPRPLARPARLGPPRPGAP